jgi:hypothetical protein
MTAVKIAIITTCIIGPGSQGADFFHCAIFIFILINRPPYTPYKCQRMELWIGKVSLQKYPESQKVPSRTHANQYCMLLDTTPVFRFGMGRKPAMSLLLSWRKQSFATWFYRENNMIVADSKLAPHISTRQITYF